MSSFRIDRIGEEIRREIDHIIREDLSDPRIGGTYSVTRAEVTRDLRYVKVYISVLEAEAAPPLLKALKSASGFIRRELGKRIIIRYTPEPIFVLDENVAYGVHIAQVLRQVAPEAAKADDEVNEPHEDQ